MAKNPDNSSDTDRRSDWDADSDKNGEGGLVEGGWGVQ